jgi:hypothetical protein
MNFPPNEPVSTQGKNNTTLIVIGVIVALCCACALIVGAVGVIAYDRTSKALSTIAPYLTASPFPIDTFAPGTPTPVLELTRPPLKNISTDTLEMLKTTLVPENDPYELACRLKGICDVSKTLPAPATPLKVGDKRKFWILNSNTNEHFQINATLRYITAHTYFWAEDGADVNMKDLKALMDTFENKIYPKDREFFGSEWTPGVDNDPHIYVIYSSNIGTTVAGYYNSSDEYNPQAREYSNGIESFVIGSDQDLGYEYTYTVLAHEFVHMIQFPVDRNDVSWINEGFAEVGAFLNGYDVGGADQLYAYNPDLQLNDWADPNSPDFSNHYGVSFLYLLYYLDRFGEQATKALTANPENDLTSVDDTLSSLNITDPQTGKLITADDVFMDFAAAMFLQDGNVGDGRYTFHNYPDAPQTDVTETISNCPAAPITRDVHQYGIDYIGIDCSGDHTLHFEGSTVTSLLPIDAHSGKYFFWSNKGDESDMTLTREFDLTNVTGPVSLSFSTWYDVEKDFDYVYLEVSEDGQNWKMVKTPSGTDANPTGANYGWAYNGLSNDWIQENVDLSDYAGKKVQVRFEYITDAAVNGEGFLLDDVHVDAINYATDFETDNGGWDAKGFVRVENVLPQTFRLTLIIEHNGTTTVQNIEMNSDQTADIPFSIQSGDTVTLIVTGTTRFTRGLANYTIEIR